MWNVYFTCYCDLLNAAFYRNCTGPVSNLVDFVPFLRNFPNLTMINRGKRLHRGLADTCGGLIKDIERRMKAGEEVPDCLAKYLLSVKEQESLDDLDITFICCAFMIGGVETVSIIPSNTTCSQAVTLTGRKNNSLDCCHQAMVCCPYSCIS